MVSNPVDVLSWFAWRRTGLSRAQVFGSGAALDTSRLKTIIGETTHLDPRLVSGYVIGEHGDSQFVPWSTVSFIGKSFAQYLEDNRSRYPDVTLAGIEEATRRRGLDIKKTTRRHQLRYCGYRCRLSTYDIVERAQCHLCIHVDRR